MGTRLADNHNFGCPVYALQNALQGESTISKWKPHCQLEVNLGPSLLHVHNVYLVLNPSTGLVSLQYHVTFDDFFETVRYNQYSTDTDIPMTWQQLAGLIDPMDIEPGIAHETIMTTDNLDQNDYTEQDPIFSTE